MDMLNLEQYVAMGVDVARRTHGNTQQAAGRTSMHGCTGSPNVAGLEGSSEAMFGWRMEKF